MIFDKARRCEKCDGYARWSYSSWPSRDVAREWMNRVCMDCGYSWREYFSEADDVRENGAKALA